MAEHIDHELKVWPEYFEAIQRGAKPFEIRKDDRGYREGDVLLLREYSPGPDEYTGREIEARVTFCIYGSNAMGFAFGLRPGFVAMGLALPSHHQSQGE
jgi:hypothetical protein